MNYYQILGISQDSSPDEIKKAYRSLSKQYHSDRNPDKNSQSIMANLNQAYEILSDIHSKKNYDLSLNPTPIYSIPNFSNVSSIKITLEQAYSGFLFDDPPIYIKPGTNNKDIIVHNNTKYIIELEPHPLFQRNDLDLLMEKTITLDEALHGVSFIFNHINGKKYTYQYNKTTIQPETKKIVEGKGMIQGDLIGNLEILFHVLLPEKN